MKCAFVQKKCTEQTLAVPQCYKDQLLQLQEKHIQKLEKIEVWEFNQYQKLMAKPNPQHEKKIRSAKEDSQRRQLEKAITLKEDADNENTIRIQRLANLEGDRNNYLNSIKINLKQSADILFRDINRYLVFRADVTHTKPKVDAPKHFFECEIAKANLSAIKKQLA
jgi:hypothetical protein